MLNPYQTIWTKPKETFETFFRERADDYVYGLPIVVYGISMGLTIVPDIISLYGDGLFIDVSTKLAYYSFSIAFGIAIAYFILAMFHPWLIKLIGKIWNGAATRHQIANANSLSAIPYCLVLLYQLILIPLGKEPSIYNVNPFFQYVLWIISFRLLIIGLSIAQKFSYGIALLNLLLSILPIVILRLAIS